MIINRFIFSTNPKVLNKMTDNHGKDACLTPRKLHSARISGTLSAGDFSFVGIIPTFCLLSPLQ